MCQRPALLKRTPVPLTSSPVDSSSTVMTESCMPRSLMKLCTLSAHSSSFFHSTRHCRRPLSSHLALPAKPAWSHHLNWLKRELTACTLRQQFRASQNSHDQAVRCLGVSFGLYHAVPGSGYQDIRNAPRLTSSPRNSSRASWLRRPTYGLTASELYTHSCMPACLKR